MIQSQSCSFGIEKKSKTCPGDQKSVQDFMARGETDRDHKTIEIALTASKWTSPVRLQLRNYYADEDVVLIQSLISTLALAYKVLGSCFTKKHSSPH